ncbi:MAG: tRNA (N(6)-L-threonylcarbamoyladenosine(37)-C(2))-methylthiotransferase MtaB [Lachnospiraceae bacterium]|nr:tRNA (N(6)-L-threonylcarbamoyladenosine(37)-C(2))-methylthiotransferase MtaB [Lachnospiraceae bacterium]
MRKKAALHNLGCKVNAYETEAMRQLLEEAGYEIVPFEPGADVYVINTCTVTNIADRKSRQMLHKAHKMNPDAIVVATGCYVETADGAAEKDPAIDIVLGNNRKGELLAVLREYEERQCAEQEAFSDKIDINHTKEYENLQINRTEARTRADIKVQDGCNQFCTYCIIPFARGRVRSRAMDDVLNEVSMLAKSGCHEVVLTGIHLSSYGVDLGTNLTELIQAVHGVEGITRIRLGSLEPGIVTPEFAHTLSSLPKVCPHFHLSLQSGCDTVLKRMNRRYTSGEFEEKCRILREAFDQPALTTDVIVGFPGETEEEFATTVDFLTRIGLYETHIFKYSRRQGTKAAVMPDQIPESVKGVRSDRLLALGEENRTKFEQSWLGKPVEVLFEEQVTIDEKPYFVGYTKEYIRVAIPADQDYANRELTGILQPGPAEHVFLFTKKPVERMKKE